jgi:hypothetical protein
MQQAAENGGAMAEKFNALGISNAQLGDSAFSVVDAMAALGKESNSNAELIGMLGARSAAVIPILREMAQNHQLAAEAAEHVGALLPSEIAAMQEYHAAVATLTEQFENFATRALASVVPAMRELVSEFMDITNNGQGVKDALSIIGDVLGSVVVSAVQLGYAFKGALDIIINGASLAVDPLLRLGQAMDMLAHGKFKEVGDLDLLGGLGPKWHKIMDDFDADVARGEAAVQRMQTAVSGLDEVHPNLQKEQAPKQTTVPEDDNTAEYLKAMEARARAHAEFVARELKDDQDYLAAAVKAADEAGKAQMEQSVASLEAEKSALQDRLKNHEISYTDELDSLRRITQLELAARREYYDNEIKLAAAAGKDTTALLAEEVKATQSAALQMQKATQQATDSINRSWQSVANGMGNLFASNITRVITGTQTMAQAMRNIFASMVESIVSSLVKIAAQMIINAAIGKATGADQAKSNILANAAQAASGAMASAAQIPLIGWLLAPIEGAAIYAAALAFGNNISSAAGGFDIPAGLNPMTQLHENEMVLPAHLAEGFRGIIANMGGQQQQASGPRGTINLTSTVNHDGQHLVDHDQFVKLARQAGFRFSYNTR